MAYLLIRFSIIDTGFRDWFQRIHVPASSLFASLDTLAQFGNTPDGGISSCHGGHRAVWRAQYPRADARGSGALELGERAHHRGIRFAIGEVLASEG